VTPNALVLDAGPVIALLHAKDPDHALAVRGFQALARVRSRLVAPLPILFEVFKWVLYEAGPEPARTALERLRDSVELVYIDPAMQRALIDAIVAMPHWGGTLEDACVALLAAQRGIPLWTLNYRDLSAFSRVAFWAPPVR
jgi:predicted nucleic acid-binding protein